MTVGMAVNSGNAEKKLELSNLLEKAATQAIDLGLWIEGRPFDVTLRQIAQQLDPSPADLGLTMADGICDVLFGKSPAPIDTGSTGLLIPQPSQHGMTDGGRTAIGNTATCESCDEPLDACTCDDNLPPDPEGGNEQRAAEGEDVLFNYESGPGEAPYVGIKRDSLRDLHEQNLSDMICNFGHFCDRNGLDMQEVLQRAKGHYDAETDNKGAQFTASN